LGIDELTLPALTRPATAPSGGRYDEVLHTDTAFSLGACKPWPGFEFGSPQARSVSPDWLTRAHSPV
jgi:hypothetical protein